MRKQCVPGVSPPLSQTPGYEAIMGPKSLLQLSTFPNKAQGFDIFVCLLRMHSSRANAFYCFGCVRGAYRSGATTTKAMSFCA